MTRPMSATTAPTQSRGSIGVALLRITLGVIILWTWWNNLRDDFYTADGLTGYFNWLFTPAEDGGNGSTLTGYKSLLDNTLLKAPAAFGLVQTIVELLFGLGLLFGVFTRAASLAAAVFFLNLFFANFGGHEWIWTYVILTASSLAVFLSWGGRMLGVDQALAAGKGESPLGLLW